MMSLAAERTNGSDGGGGGVGKQIKCQDTAKVVTRTWNWQEIQNKTYTVILMLI